MQLQEGSCPVATPTRWGWGGIPSLPLATPITPQYIGPAPTETPEHPHKGWENAYHAVEGIDLQHVEEERMLIPESIYVPETWIIDLSSGERAPH
jgi:hypothetical protein